MGTFLTQYYGPNKVQITSPDVTLPLIVVRTENAAFAANFASAFSWGYNNSATFRAIIAQRANMGGIEFIGYTDVADTFVRPFARDELGRYGTFVPGVGVGGFSDYKFDQNGNFTNSASDIDNVIGMNMNAIRLNVIDGNFKGFISVLAHEILHPLLGIHKFSGTNATYEQLIADDVYKQGWKVFGEIGGTVFVTTGPGQYTIYSMAGGVTVPGATPISEELFFKYSAKAQSERNGGPIINVDGTVNQVVTLSIDSISINIDAFNRALKYADAGGIVGSTLGRFLAKDNVVKGIVYSSLLGEIGERLAVGLAGGGRLEAVLPGARNAALDTKTAFGGDVANRISQAAVGTVSSLLTMELGEALGLKGFGAELFGATGGTVLNQALSNLTNFGPSQIFSGFQTTKIVDPLSGQSGTLPSQLPGLLANAIGSFFGSKLAGMIVSPQTQAGVALSSIGSALGVFMAGRGIGAIGTAAAAIAAGGSSIFGGAAATFAFNALLPGVGALVGSVLGALVGNLFGKKKPRTPTGSAETVLQIPNARYELGAITVANNGNRDLVTSMATTARDALNGLIGLATPNSNPLYVANINGATTTQIYGHSGETIYAKINGVQTNFASADQAVEFGSLTAIRNTKIVGGNLLVKRAMARSAADSLTSMAADIEVARDYKYYRNNRLAVDQIILDAYSSLSEGDQTFYANNKAMIDKAQTQGLSALSGTELTTYNANTALVTKIIRALENQSAANSWIITLQRVNELGLDKWTASDFYGGLGGFLTSFDFTAAGARLEETTVSWDGSTFGLSNVNAASPGLFADVATASADGKSLTIENFLGSGLGYSAPSASTIMGNNFTDARGAGVGGTFDDSAVVNGVTVNGGDDIIIGTNFADTITGRAGWDWLMGMGGNDVVRGGQDQDWALGGDGDDQVFGDLGDDYLSGDGGNDTLRGGAGNDTLIGKAGTDLLYGEDGDDLFIVTLDGNTVFDGMDGGAGSDTVDYRRFTSAIAINLTTLGAFSGEWAGSAVYYGDAIKGIENVSGTGFDDDIIGDGLANILSGGAGNDGIAGGDGNDILEGGVGADRIYGGGGSDTASYASSAASVYVDLGALKAVGGDADGDSVFESIENLRGSNASDKLRGNSGANRLEGLGGHDYFVATAGADNFIGGDGVDFVDYAEASAGVTLNLGGYTPSGLTNGSGSGGLASGHTFTGLEGVVGSAFGDNLSAGAGDQYLVGGKGADTLAGGAGADNYFLARGDGADIVNEDNTGWNVFSFAADVKFSDLYIAAAGGSGGYLDIGIRGTGDSLRMQSNFGAYPTAGNNKLKAVSLANGGQLDIGGITFAMAGSDSADTLTGSSVNSDLIFGYSGADSLSSSGATVEYNANILIGGLGDDTLIGSMGDDQFGLDRGDGVDTIIDTGGEDTLVFGSTAVAEDVIYEIVNGHLFVGLKDPNNTALTASQVSTRVLITDGGTIYQEIEPSTGNVLSQTINTIEFVSVAGASIDLRKLNIDWAIQQYWNYNNVNPIVMDLNGDGLNLSTVEDSSIIVRSAEGGVSKLAWVGPADGILAVDRNGDGKINQLTEISFSQDKAGAKSDLEGLTAWDTNADGVLDKSDKDFSKLLLWVDGNQNGRSTKKELRTLDEAGITSINLKGQATGYTQALGIDSFVQNNVSFSWKDGKTGQGYDVSLARRLINTEGLYAGAYDKSWGAKDGDGELGRLANDPIGDLLKEKGLSTVLDKLKPVATLLDYQSVLAKAKLDFTDTDAVDEKALARWTRDDTKMKAWLAGDASAMVGAEHLDKIRSTSVTTSVTSQPKNAALSSSQSASASFIAAPMTSDASSSAPAASGPPIDWVTGAGDGAIDPGTLNTSGGLDPFTPQAGTVSYGWWREGPQTASFGNEGSLARLMTAMDALDPGLGGFEAAVGDPNLLGPQSLLRQAMAGMGGAGGAAAIWTRSPAETTTIAASLGVADTLKTRSYSL